MRRSLAKLSLCFALAGCTADIDPDESTLDDMVTVDTSTRLAREQYDADVAFATGYVPTCTASSHARPRVLVSGFGRFRGVTNNASGRIVAALGGIAYPETSPPRPGTIAPPAPQLSVGTRTITLPEVGEVDLCAIVLPVVWDLAPILLVKELAAWQPDLVIMTGVSDATQPLWIELGAINEAVATVDATNVLVPTTNSILKGTAHERANLMSWTAIRAAARRSITATTADDPRFGTILTGTKLVAPRSDNSYLCNNVTYITSYLMDQPANTPVSLLRASEASATRPDQVTVQLDRRYNKTPRVFFHLPTRLTYPAGIRGGADLVRAVIDAQLSTTVVPTRGDI